MSAGPTNRMDVESPLSDDPREVILRTVIEEGCVCEAILLEKQETTEEMEADRERRGAERITAWVVTHEPHCPLLAKQAVN